MSTVVTWLLTDESGNELRMPVTDVNRIMSKVFSMADISEANRIAQGGVIKREYMTHDIMTIVGVFDNDHIPDYTQYEKGARYYNSTENKLYLRWTDGWIQPVTPDLERMFVSMDDGKVYRYFDGELKDVGGGGLREGIDYVILQ